MKKRSLCFWCTVLMSFGDVVGLILWLMDVISIREFLLLVFVLHIIYLISVFLFCLCPRCGLLLFVRRSRHFWYISLPWPVRKCARCNLEFGSDYVPSVSEQR